MVKDSLVPASERHGWTAPDGTRFCLPCYEQMPANHRHFRRGARSRMISTGDGQATVLRVMEDLARHLRSKGIRARLCADPIREGRRVKKGWQITVPVAQYLRADNLYLDWNYGDGHRDPRL